MLLKHRPLHDLPTMSYLMESGLPLLLTATALLRLHEFLSERRVFGSHVIAEFVFAREAIGVAALTVFSWAREIPLGAVMYG